MIAPFFPLAPAVTAVPVGIAFGAALERAGLGSARTIADQLTGRDFTVIKVMFSAIVTAMLGVFWASRLGWLDLSRVAVPTTDLFPQFIGAVAFGAGFALASLCPGTACVSAATGTRDGLMTIGGLFAGTLAASLLWPHLGAVAELAPRDARLPGDLHLPSGAIVALIAGLGILVMRYADRIAGNTAPARPAGLSSLLAVTGLALGGLAAFTGGGVDAGRLATIASEISREADHVDPLDLAQWIHDERPGLRVIDVREDLAPEDYQIPGAESQPLAGIAGLQVKRGETIVLYSDGGAHAAQAWVLLRARGLTDVYVLKDGLAAWEDEVLSPLVPPPSDSAATARFQRTRALADYFGGHPRLEDRSGGPAPRPPSDGGTAVRPRRRNTC